jgi:2-dehydropantoate 2-reductase
VRIGIIGGGAIGLLFGAKLAMAGENVTIWTRTAEQRESIVKAGISLTDELGTEHFLRVAGETLSEARLRDAEKNGLSPADWYLLALKQTDLTSEAIDVIARLIVTTPGTPPLVCLQNGTGHLGKLAAAAKGRFAIYNAVTSSGAKREDIRSVRHTGSGPLYLESSTDGVRQKMLLNCFIRAGFDASLSNDIHNRVFQKLLINAIINPLTAIYDMTNGELPAHSGRLSLMKALHDETASILRAAGMEDWPDSWSGVLGVCERTSLNVSSMLADVRAGRRTEIDAINGEVVRLGASSGLGAPLNECMLRLVSTLGSGDAANGDR